MVFISYVRYTGENMITNSIEPNRRRQSFGKFLKFEGKNKAINNLRTKLQETSDDILTLKVKKGNSKSTLYVLSGKHFDKFLNFINNNIYFRELRTNIEKYMKESPKKTKI